MILAPKREIDWTDGELQTNPLADRRVCATDLNRLASIADPISAAFGFGNDAAGNRLTKTAVQAGNPNPVSVLSQYSYDNIYELTQAVVNGSVAEGYTYDAVGNRLTSAGPTSYNYNTSNELTSTSVAAYTYDNNGNTLSKTTSAGTTSYTWDFENRLSSVTLPGTGGIVNFQYDPFGRRIYKSSPAGTYVYVYDGPNVIQQLGSGGNPLASFTQGLRIDEPLAIYSGSAPSYCHADGLGSVASLTDPTGAVAASYVYDSFGNLTASTGTVTNPFQYTGREFDSETGLYYYRARYYDPTTGRFLSEDPVGFFSGTADFYAYVHNDPLNLLDPFGLKACKDATRNCIQRALQALFPGVTASVGDATQETGGHWNFNVQLQFSSYDAANAFYSSYTTSATNGWPPAARFGSGPSLHLENLGNWTVNNGTYSIAGTAHIDLYNPNDASDGGGGTGGLAAHIGIDGLIGHLVQALGSNIDPANCPW